MMFSAVNFTILGSCFGIYKEWSASFISFYYRTHDFKHQSKRVHKWGKENEQSIENKHEFSHL